ncbi:MAG TPA: hypothetical protein VGL87_12740, partial [Steroidobacteraceae bacterium]
NKADYYRLLLAVTREGAWESWLLYMLRSVEDTAVWTVAKIGAIRALAAHTADLAHTRRQWIRAVLLKTRLVEDVSHRTTPPPLGGIRRRNLRGPI